MKRTLSLSWGPATPSGVLALAGLALVASTYGLVRLAYGLFLPDVQADLALGDRAAGYVSSGASLAYCVGALAGLVADRRPRTVLTAAVLTGGVGATGMALAPGAGTFAVAAVLASSSAGLASPALVAIVDRQVAADRRERAQAVVNSGTGPGLVAAGLLAVVLLPDWRAGFAAGAAATLLCGGLVLLLARGGSSGPAGPRPAGYDAGHAATYRVPALLVPALGALGLGAASAAAWTYGRAHLAAQGLGETATTVAWIGIGVGGTATVLTARHLAARSPRAGWAVTVAAVACALVLLGAAGGAPVPAGLACALFGWGFVAATSALIAWAGELRPQAPAGLVAGFFVLLVLGQALGSALAGEVTGRSGSGAAFLLAGAVAALSCAASLPGRAGTEPSATRSDSARTPAPW
ncbi:putative MFS family arabinose efflux permease [Nocardioides zeae]|uniref:MFS family arabinose efflux permease n=1 Tax=Nocardioides zeae TaxID=1457234 RepID=A0ACC6IE96_9ACTN|nr:MFS transporter [Nocardioides zeae]MDR6174151.1 putative MFS family arabinose efflux permease [Nocardioides zeae]MDR6208958.1 putative MFS family arabinose efflux permease [Nocardioides zeae]